MVQILKMIVIKRERQVAEVRRDHAGCGARTRCVAHRMDGALG
jgi:hypothetical protein